MFPCFFLTSRKASRNEGTDVHTWVHQSWIFMLGCGNSSFIWNGVCSYYCFIMTGTEFKTIIRFSFLDYKKVSISENVDPV